MTSKRWWPLTPTKLHGQLAALPAPSSLNPTVIPWSESCSFPSDRSGNWGSRSLSNLLSPSSQSLNPHQLQEQGALSQTLRHPLAGLLADNYLAWLPKPSPRPAPSDRETKLGAPRGCAAHSEWHTVSVCPLGLADPDCPSSLDSLTPTVCSPPAGTASAGAFSCGCEAAERHLQGMQFSTLASNPEVGDTTTPPLPREPSK